MEEKLEPGWAEELGLLETERPEVFRARRRPVTRKSAAHDYQCGLNGSRRGGHHTAQKLDRLLGKADEG